MPRPTFSAVVTSHANDGGLRSMLGNLMYQTRPPDETIVLVSDPYEPMRLSEDFPHVRFHQVPNRRDWGHEKRAQGIHLVTGDWMGFFNDDDSYVSDYIAAMLELVEEDVDVVYCNWNEIRDCDFRLGSSTSGNFIVRTTLAQKVGWRYRDYEADGKFIHDLIRKGARRIVKHPGLLYFHNEQR